MMMGGSSKHLDSLSSLVDFLSNPDAAKKAIDEHQQAIADHKQAADEHRNAKEEAIAAHNKLQERIDFLDEYEKSSQYKREALDNQSLKLNSWHLELTQREKVVKDLHDKAAAAMTEARNKADQIVASAKVKAGVMVKEQSDATEKLTNEFIKKNSDLEKLKTEYAQAVERVTDSQVEFNRRLADVAKREKVLADFAEKFGK